MDSEKQLSAKTDFKVQDKTIQALYTCHASVRWVVWRPSYKKLNLPTCGRFTFLTWLRSFLYTCETNLQYDQMAARMLAIKRLTLVGRSKLLKRLPRSSWGMLLERFVLPLAGAEGSAVQSQQDGARPAPKPLTRQTAAES